MASFDVTRHETGVVRVFAINLQGDEAVGWLAEDAASSGLVEKALGVSTIDADGVEITSGAALKPIGLSVYLVEGMGLPEDEVAADRARLDALDGPILIVRSAAFGGIEGRVSPGPALTLVGTYREPHALPDFEPLVSDGARRGDGEGAGTEPPGPAPSPAPAPASRRWVMVLIAAVILVLLIGVLLG